MKEYLRLREKERKRSGISGVILTLTLHLSLVAVCATSGLKYLDPPPQEDSFVLDFTEVPEEEISLKQNPDPASDQSPFEGRIENLTPQTKTDEVGDVDLPAPEPKQEPQLDARASFPGMAKKDTTLTAPHSAVKSGGLFRSGDYAELGDREVEGHIVKPAYHVQDCGIVVVIIKVDQYGRVKSAVPEGEGTTTDNIELKKAAREAALKTRFKVSDTAPVLQEGTITYHFNLQ